MSKGFIVGIGFEPPLRSNRYMVGSSTVKVSHPAQVELMYGRTLLMPAGASSVFEVEWDGAIETTLQQQRQSSSKTKTIFDALSVISEIMLGLLIVRIGHIDSGFVRTVGIADTLFFSQVEDGKIYGGFNSRSKQNFMQPGATRDDQVDPLETTKLALPEITNPSMPVARRFARCFELIDRGYYAEATIIAFSILDDIVQEVIQGLLKAKGLDGEKQQRSFLRAIKEQRLKTYLDPLMKVLWGNSVEHVWTNSLQAIEWLNGERNKIAHNGGIADIATASKAIFICVRLTSGFHQFELISAEIPPDMLKIARSGAESWSDGQAWMS